jgi:endoglucanase
MNIPIKRYRLFAWYGVSIALLCLAATGRTAASEIVEVLPLTNRILMVHFKDGYVLHHKKGQKRTDEQVVAKALDLEQALQRANYLLSSSNDPAYKIGRNPTHIGRKSKGTDFAWFVDRWENNHAVNNRPDHTDEHWLYLTLPAPLQSGQTYSLNTGPLATNGQTWKWKYDFRTSRSEAVHVNLIGYVPAAPAKYAYVYHWAGDMGGVDIKPYAGKRFWLVDQVNQQAVFEGKLVFRAPADQPETGQPDDTPHRNFQNAEVYECDFSTFARPGKYVVAVEDIGCSFPFQVDPDVYRLPFVTITRALYHNRSGIALKKPYTEFERPAPHNPLLTPGFAGKLKYTTSRYLDWKNEDSSPEDRPAVEAGIKGPLDAWGWYQDAGDWDSYVTHIRVAQELLLAYEMNPGAFTDGELNIPESGNGVPDILDEAAWLPRFCHRLRQELLAKHYGTGGIGLRVCGDHFGGDGEGVPSYEDVNRTWIASGEDPVSTFGYAGMAAHLAFALQLAHVKDPEAIDWVREARESYAWALNNTGLRDETKVRPNRAYAAATLFRLTGEKPFEERLRKDTADYKADTVLSAEAEYGPFVYALGGPAQTERDPEMLARLRAAILHTADIQTDSAAKRALRWGGDFYFPMLVGQQTTPLTLPVAVAYTLVKRTDPQRARSYLTTLYTTADYFLGTNALNMTWATGLGPRHPEQVFHMDAWYNGTGRFHPGIVPYGPWKKEKEEGQGPWDHDWANKSAYPAIDQWPGAERWFDNRCSPLNSEFTIHQTIAPSAAMYGILCAPKK